METFKKLIANNRAWAEEMLSRDPEFFSRTEGGQEPHFLMVGCSDSRVPLEKMTGALPGEMFVHRNIGNQVWSTDLNMLSVLAYAVNVLDVPHVIVCGHDNCGALRAAMGPASNGVVDHWLSDIRNTIRWHRDELDALTDPKVKLAKLAELNVLQQLGILSRTPVIRECWERGKRPMLHGWVYDIASGLIRVVAEAIDSPEKAASVLPNN
ncbi:MAG: carbonic anhydrase [Gemmatimonadaceae bacterium]|nr:carbonic anhydrase [Gemmatimonadaceae bacterium]MCW5825043.1 carbonic anhydrase [Gemmatimonadaceae bacterium]